MGSTHVVINIRAQAGKFGFCVAVVKEIHEVGRPYARRAEILSTRYGHFEDLPEMLRSAQTEAEMVLSEAPNAAP